MTEKTPSRAGTRPLARPLLPALALALLAGAAARADATLDALLASRELEAAYNPVVVDYLLEEGGGKLGEPQRKQALDQLVTALKADADIKPGEQAAMALSAAAGDLIQLLGGGTAAEAGAAVRSTTHEIWGAWIDSATLLTRAGYVDEANHLFETCLTTFPDSELRGRCVAGLAATEPGRAFDVLLQHLDAQGLDATNRTLPLLGRLAALPGVPRERIDQVHEALVEHTKGLKAASHAAAAATGLAASKDPRAVPVLLELAGSKLNPEARRAASRGLLLELHDEAIVPVLQKRAEGGFLSDPHERYVAGSLLVAGGKEAGFRWAAATLSATPKKGFAKLVDVKKDEPDFRPDVVRALVAQGSREARDVLAGAIGAAEEGSWLQAWMAVGLLELGDASHAALAKGVLGKDAWAFTVVRAAAALARHGDDAGIPALARLAQSAQRGALDDMSDAQMELLRSRIADAAAAIDRDGAVDVLNLLLGDPDPAVRADAAHALARMRTPASLPARRRCLDVDYGMDGDTPRTPAVVARVLRETARSFPDAPETRGLLELGTKAKPASVRLLALLASK